MELMMNEKFNKILNIRVLNENEIVHFVNTLIEFFEIEDYIKYVSFDDSIGTQNLAIYNFDTNTLKINIKSIKKQVFKAYTLIPEINIVNQVLFTNTIILTSIYHEVIHAFQNYLIQEEDLPLGNEFYKELNYAADNYDEYIHNYQLFSFERDASISSYEAIIKYLYDVYPDETALLDYYISYIDVIIRYGYQIDESITSPIESLYTDLFRETPIEIEGIDLYDRMKLGFQIDKKEYQSYYDNTRKIILTKAGIK